MVKIVFSARSTDSSQDLSIVIEIPILITERRFELCRNYCVRLKDESSLSVVFSHEKHLDLARLISLFWLRS